MTQGSEAMDRWSRGAAWATALLVAWAVASGCVAGDGTLAEIDPDAAPMTPTYTQHVAPMMERHCTACHAPDAQPGEVEGYGYETCEKVKRNLGGLVLTVFELETMPPGGAERVTSAEELILERWIDQGMTCD